MKTKHRLVLLATLTLLVGLVACGKSEGKDESHLAQALAMVPAGTSELYFTDWSLIKEYLGVPDLSSKSSIDERREFLMSTAKGQAAASGYGANRFRDHAENWTWDNSDLVWEVTLGMKSAPPAYVLQFPGDFDFAPLLALFEERGFSQSEHQGVTVYSHEMDLKAEWLRTSEFGILNTAVLQEEKVLVLSSSIEGVIAILNVQEGHANSLADNEAAQATADRLGEVAAAVISAGPDACQGFSAGPLLEILGQEITDEQFARLKELVEEGPQVHIYTALGVGYRYEEDQPVGLIVMHYANADYAQADLEPRRQLTQEGISVQAKQPYGEVFFALNEASVEGSDLVFRVSPINDMPRRLFSMVISRDMLFAACP